MNKFPSIDNPSFEKLIDKKYSRFKIPNEKKTLKQICFPKKYEFQIPQKFLAEYINPDTPYQGILIYHKIGAGKTCSAIKIAENFKKLKKYKIIVVLPASLEGNFRSELRSPCTGNSYISEKEREILKTSHPSSAEYRAVIEETNRRIDEHYNIYSYNRFVKLLSMKLIDLKNSLVIIDEVHNMVSDTGSYYKILYDALHPKPVGLRLVIMSATPIFDKPVEGALTMNLLLDKEQIPIGKKFTQEFMDISYKNDDIHYQVKNMEIFKQYLKGYVSYYRGASPVAYPKMDLNLVKVKMSDHQYRNYIKILKKELRKNKPDDYVNDDISNSFFIGTRTISNISFPNGRVGKSGFNSLNKEDFTMAGMKNYSPKYVKILRKIKKSDGTVFVYSNFKEYGGIKTFASFLEHNGFKNYQIHGPGKKRFAIWSGDQTTAVKDEIRSVFNNKDNEFGDNIKVILGTPSSKEGVSFLRVQQVHLIEPYWNRSRMWQIIGRAFRFCSHKDVAADRRTVGVYIYLAVYPSLKTSVDEHIMKMAITKEYINLQFEKAFKEAAVDCDLFKNGNTYPGEESYQCGFN